MRSTRRLICAAFVLVVCAQRSESEESLTSQEAPTPKPSDERSAKPRERVRLLVPVGTPLPIEFQTSISSATSRQGDAVIGTLTRDVPLQGFKLDKGAEVRGEVLMALKASGGTGGARLVVAFDAVMKNGEKLSIATEPFDSITPPTAAAGVVRAAKGHDVDIPRGARLTFVVK